MNMNTEGPIVQRHEDGVRLARALAGEVCRLLEAGVAERGTASLVVSGGSTPVLFLRALSQMDAPWENVHVTLADERAVAPHSPRSNAGLVHRELLQGKAAGARFVPLYLEGTSAAASASKQAQLVGNLLPFDVVILGMGEDGHTASLFAAGDRIKDALDGEGSAVLLPMRVPQIDEERVTLTLPAIVSARHLYVHIEGNRKLAVLEQAMQGCNDLPISRILGCGREVRVKWAPDGKKPTATGA